LGTFSAGVGIIILKSMGKMKKPAKRDPSDVIPYSEQVDQTRVPPANAFIIERHQPTMFDAPYHHHTSIELNFLQNCGMNYSFSGQPAQLAADHLTVFWGAAPHRVNNVIGKGQITNIYLSLGQFLRWGLPTDLVNSVLAGNVISVKKPSPGDAIMMDRLYAERYNVTTAWRRTHLSEIETRLRRMALEGWQTLMTFNNAPKQMEITSKSMLRVEAMLSYIATNYTIQINVADIASAANLSVGRAGHLFRQVMGLGLKQQLLRARLSHSRMLLTETDAKVSNIAMDSGFSSISSFYDAFTKTTGMSPAQYREHGRRSNPFVSEHSVI
jgi:AraC-like DNA-binding protein